MKVPKPRKLPSGSWFIQLRLGGESIPVTADTEKECIKQAEFIKAEYRAGKRTEKKEKPTDITLTKAIDAYIESRKNILSPSTIRGYKTIQRTRFQAYMDTKLSAMDSKAWAAACNLEAKTCSAKTLSNSWRFIASVIKHATQGAAPEVQLPQVIPNEMPFLEPEEIKKFIKAIEGTKVEIPALLALSSLRRSEICALTWENVDLKKKQIHVKGAAVYDENQNLIQKKANKNRSSTRTVPILIDELYAALEKERQPSGLVVAARPNTLWTQVNRVCKRNGLTPVGVHGLRHSFASLAYHLGIPEKITMEIGGWADSQTMRNIYTHVAKSDRQKYTETLTNFFKNANENANDKNDA